MLVVMGMDFIKTARAKGVPAGQVIRKHVLRNALLPVVTFAGIQLGQMAGGAVLTETVFAWPGIGRLMFDALLQRDYQLLLGVFLVTATMVVIFNFLTDLIYRFIDPRIEFGT
jgi:peptide/nickel transport system permease protein